MTPDEVLIFWFEEAAGKWFARDDALDQNIRERFADIHSQAVRGETASWRETPRGRLAEIIVLDQFSRNLFRDSAKAFENDPLALRLAEEAVSVGADKKLSATERHFLYLPYMHSESREVHKQAMRMYLSLPIWKWMAAWFEYKHKKIIDRFGRYPHRNAVLGRVSTPEEVEFLKRHSGF